MFQINEDNSIYVTRGDILFFYVAAKDKESGNPYHFEPGDVLRIKVFGKKECETVILQKDFPVLENAEKVQIFLTEEDTKIGEVISKHKDYWYEVELNPDTDPQTIIGYNEDGPALFRLFPEGKDIDTSTPIEPEDIPVVDAELDLTSDRPVKNRVIAAKIAQIERDAAKDYVTPQMFGAVGDGVADDTDAIETMFSKGEGFYSFCGKFKLSHTVTVPANSILLSDSATFIQPNFGSGVFYIDGDNIDFRGTYYFKQTGEKVKLPTEGIESSALLIEDVVNNIYIDRFYIYNFIGGVVFGGTDAKNIEIEYIHIENCDFGVWGANAHNVHIGTLSFKDIDNSQNEPAHALYLTGNDREIKTTNFNVDYVCGENCVSALSDCVLSVKATSRFACERVYVKNVSCVITPLNSSGYVRNIYADGVKHYCFDVQGNSPDNHPFVIYDSIFANMDCDHYGYSVGASAKAEVKNCKFIGTSAKGFVYMSLIEVFKEENCYFKNTGANTIATYNIASANTITIINPTIIGASLANHIQSGVYVIFKLNPANIDNGLCNNAMYNTYFLPNDYFKELTNVNDNWIFNNIIADGCTITQMRGNGVYTIVNKNRTCAIMNANENNKKIFFKNGRTQYTASEWDVLSFRVLKSMAYEL